MRIISGKYRGRKLYSPQDKSVRPTSDMVRESVFNILQPHIHDAVFLDCFSGSGAMGIEAISRGAHAVFLDSSRESVRLIRKNLSLLDVDADVIQGDTLKSIVQLGAQGSKVDIVYIDPPYGLDMENNVLKALSDSGVLKDHSIIIVEHTATKDLIITQKDYIIKDIKKYGKTKLIILSYKSQQVNDI